MAMWVITRWYTKTHWLELVHGFNPYESHIRDDTIRCLTWKSTICFDDSIHRKNDMPPPSVYSFRRFSILKIWFPIYLSHNNYYSFFSVYVPIESWHFPSEKKKKNHLWWHLSPQSVAATPQLLRSAPSLHWNEGWPPAPNELFVGVGSPKKCLAHHG